MIPRRHLSLAFAACSLLIPLTGYAQSADKPLFGPYNGRFLASGLGHQAQFAEMPTDHWSISCWVQSDEPLLHTLIGGVGAPQAGSQSRYLATEDGNFALWQGSGPAITSTTPLVPGKWHFVGATGDGAMVHLYADGREIGQGSAASSDFSKQVNVGPTGLEGEFIPRTRRREPEADSSGRLFSGALPAPGFQHFSGLISGFTITARTLSGAEMAELAAHAPKSELVAFDTPSDSWPFQTREQVGYRSPQDPATLPHSLAPIAAPVAKAVLDPNVAFAPRAPNSWAILGGWQLTDEPSLSEAGVRPDGAPISEPGYSSGKWLHATVPGTVLTTYIDRGVYPDPDYGLNNLAIPEKLSRQNYWYRVEFTPPANLRHHHLTLTFKGVNYAATVWVNGSPVGKIKGAFMRGIFDVSDQLQPGKLNALAVLIEPPPHPGIPQEQSVLGGPGENGGALVLDGPTFVATEGWDWIPGIRDRNIGIWQEVTLTATEDVRIGDPQVITDLPLPDTSHADILIAAPLHNDSGDSVEGTLEASFEGVKISKKITLAPGSSLVRLTPQEFPELTLDHPRLWWPNGYGKPTLYHLNLAFRSGSHVSDTRSLRFGVREITYEVSLLDPSGHLRRVEVDPTKAAGQNVVNVLHEGMVQTSKGWVSSIARGAENSPALRALDESPIGPYLAIRVNGVRIACKGGNWGMDDSRKRVSREHLEPYFRLHRDANLNIIRNWVGQDTEETFFDLADEYGLLVWSDFWDSTQNYNAEPDDAGLFLSNARDVILRFRNHPSIAIWCGRNEGVPAPAVNRGLDELIRVLDGTRYYSPDSNSVNLQFSGPYHQFQYADYFTKFAHGFAVELGIPSFPTIDAFKAFIAPADQWPPNDVWAYHDWHFSGNGDVAPFMQMLEQQFGAGTSLEDFERKAQIMNYDGHRAIFEGFNAHLWKPNSGRLLWMTQPAWPSTMWQIFSSDYDTQASYYGVKKASEFIHVQMNLPSLTAAVVNETGKPLEDITVRARVLSKAGTVLWTKEQHLAVPASSEADAFPLEIPDTAANDIVFIKLDLLDAAGRVLSENFYTQAAKPETYRELNALPAANVAASIKRGHEASAAGMVAFSVDLTNQSSGVALMSKLTLRNQRDKSRVLPAYYSDNYISLLPGEKRTLTIEAPATSVRNALTVDVTGWNVAQSAFAVPE